MSNIYKGTLGLIGNTPLVEVANIEKSLGLKARVLVKLEYFNPAGSVKDRVAKSMIEDAEEKGLLKEGSVIKGLQDNYHHARNHECGTQKYIESLWCGACIDRRHKRHERCDCKG